MRILVTNDDGINAIGLEKLQQELSAIAEVWVAAPERERSAIGHGITVHKPLRAISHRFPSGVRGWGISGTPADCVKLALEALLDNPPDLVVSGINRGANLGTDVLYSGTVSAAIEATMAGYPAIAASLVGEDDHLDFTGAAQIVAGIVNQLRDKTFPPKTLLNINIPNIPYKDLLGIEITRLGTRRYANSVHRRRDPRGKEYFWLAGVVEDLDAAEGTDIHAIKTHRVSVSPIHFDLTSYPILHLVQDWSLALSRL